MGFGPGPGRWGPPPPSLVYYDAVGSKRAVIDIYKLQDNHNDENREFQRVYPSFPEIPPCGFAIEKERFLRDVEKFEIRNIWEIHVKNYGNKAEKLRK